MKFRKRSFVVLVCMISLLLIACYGKKIIFKNYEGPIFPLTAASDATGIEVARTVEFDFSSYENASTELDKKPLDDARKTFVTDSYILANTTDADIVIEVVYPFAGILEDRAELVPEVFVNDELIATEVTLGRMTSRYVSVYETVDAERASDLYGMPDKESYNLLLSDGNYMQEAFAGYSDMSLPAIVYELSELGYDGADKAAKSPTLKLEYAEGDDTIALTYGAYIFGNREEDGITIQERGFKMPRPEEDGYGKAGSLVVLGEDVSHLVVECYKTSSMIGEDTINDTTIEMKRYESTLEDVFKNTIRMERQAREVDGMMAELFSDEDIYGALANTLYDCGTMDGTVYNSLDSIWDGVYMEERVMYLTFDVVVPANSSVEVCAAFEKEASYGVYTEDEELDCYDVMTELGSTLRFISQNITATGTESAQMIEENDGVKTFLHP